MSDKTQKSQESVSEKNPDLNSESLKDDSQIKSETPEEAVVETTGQATKELNAETSEPVTEKKSSWVPYTLSAVFVLILIFAWAFSGKDTESNTTTSALRSNQTVRQMAPDPVAPPEIVSAVIPVTVKFQDGVEATIRFSVSGPENTPLSSFQNDIQSQCLQLTSAKVQKNETHYFSQFGASLPIGYSLEIAESEFVWPEVKKTVKKPAVKKEQSMIQKPTTPEPTKDGSKKL